MQAHVACRRWALGIVSKVGWKGMGGPAMQGGRAGEHVRHGAAGPWGLSVLSGEPAGRGPAMQGGRVGEHVRHGAGGLYMGTGRCYAVA